MKTAADDLISVILPSYNAAPYLARAATSILNQVGVNLELIIVDDGSTDSSWQIAKEIAIGDARVHCIRMECNSGYPSAMNRGLQAAQGRYFARMDADDLSLPNRLHNQIQFFDPEKYSLCGTARFRITPRGCVVPHAPVDPGVIIETWDDLMSNRRLFTDPSVLTSMDHVRTVGGYRTYTRAGQDVDLWLRLMEQFGPAIVIPTPLYGRRLLPNAITFNPALESQKATVRAMAWERKNFGLDAIQREQTEWDPPERATDSRVDDGSRSWVSGGRWYAAERCAEAGDLLGAWAFVRPALASHVSDSAPAAGVVRKLGRVIGKWGHGLISRRGRSPQRC